MKNVFLLKRISGSGIFAHLDSDPVILGHPDLNLDHNFSGPYPVTVGADPQHWMHKKKCEISKMLNLSRSMSCPILPLLCNLVRRLLNYVLPCSV